jgi:hypothetical protein
MIRAHIPKNVRAILEVRLLPVDETHIGLVDEGVGLQGVIGTLTRHLPVGETPQLGVHDGPQLVVYAAVPVGPRLQQRRDVPMRTPSRDRGSLAPARHRGR